MLRGEGNSERAIFVIDKQGIIRYVDVHDIGQQPDNEVLFEVLAELEPEAAARQWAAEAKPLPQAAARRARQADVIDVLHALVRRLPARRAWLKEQASQYVEVDISKDRRGGQRARLGHGTRPRHV